MLFMSVGAMPQTVRLYTQWMGDELEFWHNGSLNLVVRLDYKLF